VIAALLGIRSEGPAMPDPTEPFWYTNLNGGGVSTSGSIVTPDSALRVSAVYACVRVLAETVATLPCHLYERLPDGGKKRAGGALAELLSDFPNAWQTSTEFFEQSMYHLALRGNAISEIIASERGPISELVPIHPDRVTAVERLRDNSLRYTITDPERRSRTRVLMSNEVFHTRGLSSDGILGLSPIAHLRNAIGLAMSAEDSGARLFRQGIRPSGVLEHPQKLSDEAYKRLRTAQQEHAGTANAYRTMILEEGMKWSQVSLSNKDAQFLETRKFQIAEIARIFRVPPHMIQDLDKATFSNIEHQGIDFVVHTIRPWLVRFEKAIKRDLIINHRKLFAEFLVDALLRGDFNSRMSGYATAIQNEIFSRNEVREMENRNPVPGGDEFRNPITAPKAPETESTLDDENDSRASRVLHAFMADKARPMSRRIVTELRRRVKYAHENPEQFREWLAEFFKQQAEYIDRDIGPLCDALNVRSADRIALVEEIVTETIRELLDGDPVQVVADWENGALCERYTRKLKGLPA
jgi:HK97 family phage portal protein